MKHLMTTAEIRSKFEGEWVLVEDLKTNKALEVLSGRVLHHAKDRDEIYRKAIALRPKRCAILFTGEMPEDTAVVL